VHVKSEERMMNNEKKDQVSRRAFLRRGALGATAVVSAGVLVGCDDDDSAAGTNGSGSDGRCLSDRGITWDESFDVVIVGAGGAGLVAAITAAEAGAGVLLLEKTTAPGGATSYSGGVIQGSGTAMQAGFGVTDDTAEKHYQYWLDAGQGVLDPAIIRVLADQSGPALEWLVDRGVAFERVYRVDPIPHVSPDLLLDRLHVVEGGAGTYVETLREQAVDQGVEIRTETPVTALVISGEKGVVGVRASVGGASVHFQANNAVVVTAGGYDKNEEMARAYCPELLQDIVDNVAGTPEANTGDGIRLGMAVGADLAGMGGSTIAYPTTRIGRLEGGTEIPGIWVNSYGQRFVNEAGHYGYVAHALFNQEGRMAWAVFDESVRELGGSNLGRWSDDLSEEIASGDVVEGATIEALAQGIGVNAAQFSATLLQWNTDMAAGTDTVFDKQAGTGALVRPPYFATRVKRANLGSCGGLKIDPEARVIGVGGDVIPNLYAAGMAAGGFIGPYYPGSGTALAATLVFGRIAGKNAAEQGS
jgi:urocanate reductase